LSGGASLSNQESKKEGVHLEKGQEVGMFEMGSTIVLIFEAPENSELLIKEGMKLKLGQEIVTSPKK
jgi:phosphatidylserine decarboxylase